MKNKTVNSQGPKTIDYYELRKKNEGIKSSFPITEKYTEIRKTGINRGKRI